MKLCRTCKVEKPLDEFSRLSKSKDGLQPRCKECVSAYMRERHAAKRDELNAKEAARRAARTPEERAAWKQYMRDYYEANRAKWDERYAANVDELRAAARERQQRRLADPAERAKKQARQRQDYARRPDVWKAGAERRRARLQGATLFEVTEQDWRRQVARQGGCCFYCGKHERLTKDHLIPLHRGGLHSIGNIVGACARCNSQKGTKTRMEYRAWLRRMAAVA